MLAYVDPADGRDGVVDEVSEALRARHSVEVLEIHDDLDPLIRGLREQRPDLVFNLCEMFGDDVQGDARVAAAAGAVARPASPAAAPPSCSWSRTRG